MTSTSKMLDILKENGQDFEWYPTTNEMIQAVLRWLPKDAASIMDIGAGDGRVLRAFAKKCENAILYSIEISMVLVREQGKDIIPVGTDLFEQNLSCLSVDYIYSSPQYSQFEEWVCKIVLEGYAKRAYLTIPQRWKESKEIERAIKERGASTRVIYSGDFHNAERQARAVIDIVEVTFPADKWGDRVKDPFDIWFDNHINTFEKAKEEKPEEDTRELARKYAHSNIDEMVAAYREEYERMETNYRMIFKLDYALLKELGVDKDHVRGGLKKKMDGLKVKYWQILFKLLDAITSRLTTASKKSLLEKLTHNTKVEFTTTNAYAVVIWAIANANQYFDDQLIKLFQDLTTTENVTMFKRNQKTWEQEKWRYRNEWEFKRGEYKLQYKLDYLIVMSTYSRGIYDSGKDWIHSHQYPNNLYEDAHNLIADIVAVLNNLGFSTYSSSSYQRGDWARGKWENWIDDSAGGNDDVLFQVKAYLNGNIHVRFKPDAIKALNIEAARLLKWVRTKEEVVEEMGYTVEDANKYFKSNAYILPSNVRLLNPPKPEPVPEPEPEIVDLTSEELAELLPDPEQSVVMELQVETVNTDDDDLSVEEAMKQGKLF